MSSAFLDSHLRLFLRSGIKDTFGRIRTEYSVFS